MSNLTHHWFWSETFWLPQKRTWEEFRNVPGSSYHYPEVWDLLNIVPIAVGILFFRYGFENFLAKPLAVLLQIDDHSSVHLEPNQVLERAYCNNHTNTVSLAKKTEWTEYRVKRWIRSRTKLDQHSHADKFSEVLYKTCIHLILMIYGLYVVSTQTFSYDTISCWVGLPTIPVDRTVFFYYMVEMAHYVCEFPFHFIGPKRKDFYIMLTHHCATLTLLVFSWICNYVRIGALVLCVHDIMDPFLYGAKVCSYAELDNLLFVMLVLLCIVYYTSRIFVYPYYVLYSSVFESAKAFQANIPFLPNLGRPNTMSMMSYWGLLNTLLVVLQFFHFIWGYYLAMFVLKCIQKRGLAKDTRSDSEGSTSDISIEQSSRGLKINGVSMNGSAQSTVGAQSMVLTSSRGDFR